MIEYSSLQELIALAGNGTIGEVVLRWQAEIDGCDPSLLRTAMQQRLEVMRESIANGMNPDLRSNSGMVGGQASILQHAVDAEKTVSGTFMGKMAVRALAVAESNACMGKIVAAPTAGSCGILPSALLSCQEQYGYSDDELVTALFTAAGVGQVIAERASISGAEGGCQAECGTAAAMAAAAMTQLRGGSASACGNAVSFTLMNMMGLVCDPLCGLVEVPCVYRNVSGVANAVVAADMALSGLTSILPPDELIDAMGSVGKMMPESLRETGLAGCAACSRIHSPSAKSSK